MASRAAIAEPELDAPAAQAGEVALSLVIPARNEEAAIERVLGEFKTALAALGVCSEIIVVDDASTDQTAARATLVAGVRVIKNPRNLGYGHSLLRGMEVARGRYFAIADADGTYPPASLATLWKLINDGADHAIGRRTGDNLTEHFGMRMIYRWLCNYVAGEDVPDANSGLRIMDRRIVEELRGDLCRGFSFTTSLTLASLLSGWVVAFAPIPYSKRVGKSHVRRLRDALRTAQYLVQIVAVYNPLKLYLPLIGFAVALGFAGFLYGAIKPSPWGTMTAVLMAAVVLILIGLSGVAYISARSGARRRGPGRV
ncbi:MAG: glycosyltransferase family 2 protein [Planctomycetes bacterium]|nr:glycosyltransferase family 2 protein [Planctomycetota bacterium]